MQTISRRKLLGLPVMSLVAMAQPGQAEAPTAPRGRPSQEPTATLAQYTELVECIIFTALVVNVHSSSLLHQLQRIQRLESMVWIPDGIPDFRSNISTLENLSRELQEKIQHARHALHL